MSESHNRSLGSSARVAIGRLGASNLLVLAATCLSLGLTLYLFWPSLREGLFADDYIAMSMLDGKFGAARAPLDLFNFAGGTPEDVNRLRQLGSIPWWAPDDFRVSFLRPLSSALWHLDRALFGQSYAYYHAHSLLVFSLLVIATALLYRGLFPGLIAALALVIFAVDDSHQFPVLWLSNRGGIYASLCGVLALLAHLRWRERGQRGYAYLSAAAIAIGFLFGEWALPMLAYILAFELLGARGAVRSRLWALLPSAILTVVFLGVRAHLQYGARGSGAYIDPGVDPIRFLLTACHRVPIFMADMMWNVPAEWWDQGSPPWRDELLSYGLFPPSVWVKLPDWRLWHITLGALACAALGLGYRFCRPGLSESENRHLRWLVLGSLGALMPVVGSFPSTRLTIASFLGIAPLLACVFREVARRLRAATRVQPLRFAAYYLVILGLVHIQFVAPLQTDIQARVNWFTTTSNWVLAAELDPARAAEQRVFLLSGYEFTTTFYFAYIWSLHGLPRPRRYYPLTASPIAHFIERSADNELVLEGVSGNYFGSGHENMFHAPERTWRAGQVIALEGVRITIDRVERGVPGRLRFTFDRTLEDPSYVFLVARPFGLVRFTPPPVGTNRLLARAASPSWFELDRHRYLRRIAPLPEVLGFSPVPAMVYYKPP
jgi:hypothetical protein